MDVTSVGRHRLLSDESLDKYGGHMDRMLALVKVELAKAESDVFALPQAFHGLQSHAGRDAYTMQLAVAASRVERLGILLNDLEKQLGLGLTPPLAIGVVMSEGGDDEPAAFSGETYHALSEWMDEHFWANVRAREGLGWFSGLTGWWRKR